MTENSTIDLLDFDREGLEAELSTALNEQRYRARQVVQWVYRKRVRDFQEMTNISREVRGRLAERYRIFRPELATTQQSTDGSRKYLFKMDDGSMVESVLIRQPTRYTLCISSQVGCAIGCRFCRTGLMGLTRHLKTSEIIGQVLAVQDDIAARRVAGDLDQPSEDFSNIVFMGMGEPLHNIDNVVRAVKLLNDELGLNFSSRKITVSTSGLVPAIQQFGASGAGANLAVSLNATTDEVRNELIPINRKWPLAELLKTLREYPLRNRKRITMEYVMLRGVNDTDADLERLPTLVRGIPVKINLIPYNENTGLGYYPPDRDTIAKWQDTLLSNGLNATIRWSKGQDISAACGQLATESSRRKPVH
ncbi:MAG: 23S rRNA (adenine(2503)-C(2))-methyltransferase RlmN [Bdellovibrionota bacterium]